jgi:hypothetical protein
MDSKQVEGLLVARAFLELMRLQSATDPSIFDAEPRDEHAERCGTLLTHSQFRIRQGPMLSNDGRPEWGLLAWGQLASMINVISRSRGADQTLIGNGTNAAKENGGSDGTRTRGLLRDRVSG